MEGPQHHRNRLQPSLYLFSRADGGTCQRLISGLVLSVSQKFCFILQAKTASAASAGKPSGSIVCLSSDDRLQSKEDMCKTQGEIISAVASPLGSVRDNSAGTEEAFTLLWGSRGSRGAAGACKLAALQEEQQTNDQPMLPKVGCSVYFWELKAFG